MAMESARKLSIQVKYGESVKVFKRLFVDNEVDLNMDGLVKKILSLFKFGPETNLNLTYVDKDGDIIELDDDDDLCCALDEAPDTLRITVQLNTEKNGPPPTICSSMGSPLLQQLNQDLNSSGPEMVKNVPEPPHETLAKLSTDSVSKASYIDQISEPQTRVEPGTKNVVQKTSSVPLQTKDSEVDKVPINGVSQKNSPKLKHGLSSKKNEVKDSNVVEETSENSSSKAPASKDVADIGCVSKNITTKKIIATQPSEKSAVNEEKGINKPDESHLVPEHANRIVVPMDFGLRSHDGVDCKGCGMFPIEGLRFKSIVETDYDLCSRCFEKIGTDSEYVRIEFSSAVRNCCPYTGWDIIHKGKRILPLPEIDRTLCSMADVTSESCLVKDVNIPDGTVMAPKTKFTKIWRLRNIGTAVWPKGTFLHFHYGDKMTHTSSVQVGIPAAGLAVGKEVDVHVDFISPKYPGRYISHWKLTYPFGSQFWQRQHIWLLIEVASAKKLSHVGRRGSNLNLPTPPNSVLTGPEIIDVNLKPTMESSARLPKPNVFYPPPPPPPPPQPPLTSYQHRMMVS